MSKFTDAELLLVGGRELATIAGRLRLAHEGVEKLSIKTELIDYELGVRAVVRAEITTAKGAFTATGTATAERDGKVKDALVEVAETRAVARGLRFAGCGFELGVEELGDAALAANTVPDARRNVTPPPLSRINPGDDGARRQRRGGTPATAAQRRCVAALAARLHVDPGALVARFTPGIALEDLSIGDASRVIDAAKRSAGANGDGRGQA